MRRDWLSAYGFATISVAPDLQKALADYAAIYQQTYGEEQSISDLIPHMLAAFLASDRGFAKAREGLAEWSAVGRTGDMCSSTGLASPIPTRVIWRYKAAIHSASPCYRLPARRGCRFHCSRLAPSLGQPLRHGGCRSHHHHAPRRVEITAHGPAIRCGRHRPYA